MDVTPSVWEQVAPAMFDRARWDRGAEEVDAVLALLHLTPPAAVLDLACGPGRHVVELGRRGYDVTGVDVSAAFLEVARAACAAEALSPDLVREDMRAFRRAEAFDAVVSMSTSFGYFDDPADDALVLRNAHASLRAGGAILIELVGKEVAALSHDGRRWTEDGDALLLTEQRVRPGWTWIDNRMTVISGGERSDVTLSHRLYSGAELARLLVECGFRDVELFGGFGGTPYDHTATRLVAVALK
ncbi:MAG: class I SAM-dependent methyltransferase [Actinomycetota bacterium]